MRYAALVIRISDSRQDTSPANQRAQLKSYIDLFFNSETDTEGKKITTVEVYREYELLGVSGKDSFDSTEFQELRDDVLRGNVQIVMATGLDRFGRNVVKFLDFFKFLRDNKVDLIVTQYQIDTTGPIGVLVITILMALAEMQREQYSLKQKGTQHTRFTKARRTGGSIPLGFDRHPTVTGLYVENESESPIVRFLFSKYLELKNITAVARAANSRGYRTKERIEKGVVKGGKPFTDGSVRYILENMIYIGILEEHKINKGKPDSEVPEDQRYSEHTPEDPEEWPHLVDDLTFRAVQTLLTPKPEAKKPSSRKTYPYILSGLAECALCGSLMRVEKGKGHRYYACQNKGCSGKKLIPEKYTRIKRNTITAPVLDNAVKCVIKDTILGSPDTIKEITMQANEHLGSRSPLLAKEILSLNSRKEVLLAEKRGILRALAGLEEDQASSGMLMGDLKAVTDSLIEIENSISQRTTERDQSAQLQVTEAEIRRALEVLVLSLEGVPDEKQKELIQMFIEKVRVGVEEIEAHLLLDSILYLARKGPDPDKFDWSKGWYARQDLNPEPSGP